MNKSSYLLLIVINVVMTIAEIFIIVADNTPGVLRLICALTIVILGHVTGMNTTMCMMKRRDYV